MIKKILSIMVGFVFISPCFSLDSSYLCEKIAKSINDNINGLEYKKIAFWRIINNSSLTYDEYDFSQLININLLTTKFEVTDRFKLNQILKEMEIGKEISPEQMKELNERAGIDLFLYGTFYNNTIADKDNVSLILKAIDLKKTKVVWAIELPITKQYYVTSLDLAIDQLIKSFSTSTSRISQKNIKRISFWEIRGIESDKEKQIIDKLIVKLPKDQFEIVDRDAILRLIQELSAQRTPGIESTPQQAEEIAKKYDIDGFIYGSAQLNLATRSELTLQMMSLRKDESWLSLVWGYKAIGELRQIELIINSAISFVLTVAILLI